jgi:putative membrane protein
MDDAERTPDHDVDASRRTRLASERTVLAWLRTGLTATAVALGIGKVIPDLGDGGATWPYVAIGVGYAVLGLAVVVYGLWRGRAVERALDTGGWAGLDDRAMWAIGSVTSVLALMTIVVLIADA